MIQPQYKFYLDDTEVFPVYKTLTKKYEKENDNIFFRVSLDGDIKLYNVSLELDKKYTFTIKSFVNGEWSEYYKGTFSKTDCEIDYDKRSVKLKLTIADEYTDILDKEEKTYNLLDQSISTKYVSIDKRPMLQTYIPGSDTIGCFLSNIWFEQECTSVDDENQLVSKYKFGKSPVSYKYIELSADEVGDLQELLLSTYMGVLTEKSETDGNGNVTHTWSGNFYSVTAPQYYIEVLFTRYTSSSGASYNKRTSSYKLKFSGSDSPLYQTEYTIATGSNDDESRWENDTFTLAPVNPVNKPIDGALFTRNIYSRWVCDKETYDGKATDEIPSDDLCSNNRNYRRCVPWSDQAGIELSQRTSKEPTKWGMADNYEYFLPPTDTTVYYPISRSIWGIVSFWHNASYSVNVVESELTKTYLMKNAYDLSSCIQALLKCMGSDIKHEGTTEYSEFLYSSTNPVVNRAFSLLITQKTNILKGEYDQPAQKAEVTFKDVMNMLQQCFRCYWFVENGKLRIEHISWFINGGSYNEDKRGVQLDLTASMDNFNRMPISYMQNSMSYDKDSLPSRYEFSWADDSTVAFEGKTININNEYVQKDKSEEVSVDMFTSDVDLMLLNPSAFSEDGFALLGVIPDGTNRWKLPYVDFMLTYDPTGEKEEKDLLAYTVRAQNGYMAWSFLEIFYMWDLPGGNISVDGVFKVGGKSEYYIRSLKKSMRQSVRFVCESALDMNKLIKTNIGEGQIDNMSVEMNTGVVEAELLYEPK